jgi:hypothetical protein
MDFLFFITLPTHSAAVPVTVGPTFKSDLRNFGNPGRWIAYYFYIDKQIILIAWAAGKIKVGVIAPSHCALSLVHAYHTGI